MVGYQTCRCQSCGRSFRAFCVGGPVAWCSLRCSSFAQAWRWRVDARRVRRYRRTRLSA